MFTPDSSVGRIVRVERSGHNGVESPPSLRALFFIFSRRELLSIHPAGLVSFLSTYFPGIDRFFLVHFPRWVLDKTSLTLRVKSSHPFLFSLFVYRPFVVCFFLPFRILTTRILKHTIQFDAKLCRRNAIGLVVIRSSTCNHI